MLVTKGSNYADSRAKVAIRIFRKLDLCHLKWIAGHGKQQLLREADAKDTYFYIVESDYDLRACIKEAKGTAEKRLVGKVVRANRVIGFVALKHKALDEINILWVAKQWHGLGFGSGLLNLAFQHSKRGLRSSDNIGTMFLACMWKLYQKNLEMRLLYAGKPVPRDEVILRGTNLWYNKINLCNPSRPDFWFEWRK